MWPMSMPRSILGEPWGAWFAKNLVNQVVGSVQWVNSIQILEKDALAIEVGPGQVLKGLMRRCRPDVTCYSIDRDGVDTVCDVLSGVGEC